MNNAGNVKANGTIQTSRNGYSTNSLSVELSEPSDMLGRYKKPI